MPRAFSADEQERIRARLVEVGHEHVARTGFRRTTVDALARSAGVSKGGFYLFFASKEELFVAVLRDAELELRERLLAIVDDTTRAPEACLRAVLRAIFDAVTVHPMLRALGDPEELAWLARALPPGAMEEARRDDDAFFARLHRRLRKRGAIGARVPARLFAGLPGAALALVHGRALVGEDRFDALVELQLDAWTAILRAP